MSGHPGYWREADGSTITQTAAEAEWVEPALEVLREVATVYGALIDYPGLAGEVQQRSGIHTRVPASTWIGGVLRGAMAAVRATGDAPLTSLVVPKIDASVGATVDARPRLQCYQRYGADLPADARAALAPPPAARRAVRQPATGSGATGSTRRAGSSEPAGVRSRPSSSSATSRARRDERPEPLCPRCFLALPATGICDTCG